METIVELGLVLIMTGMAAYFDQKQRIIPNELVFSGIIIGLVLSHSVHDLLVKLFVLFFLFVFGTLHLMGMGDLKLWMAISCMIGFRESLLIIGGAALFLIAGAFLDDFRQSKRILTIATKNMMQSKRLEVFEQPSYAFATYIFAASIAYALWITWEMIVL